MTEGKNTLTWEDLKAKMSAADAAIEFRAKKDLIFDKRFIPPFSFESVEEKTRATISALGSMLICLLSKNIDLPNNWNPIGHQLAWSSMYRTRLKDVPVSSLTRSVIDACFSKRNIESILLKSFEIKPEFAYANDGEYDPPELFDISDFFEHIQRCQENLQKYQITVSSHQPRQLIPVSLIQLKRESNHENHPENAQI